MATFTFLLSTEPLKFEAVDTVLNVAEALIHKGHKILGIFLYGSGVQNLKKDTETGKTVRNLPKRLEQFAKENHVEVTGCTTWIAASGIKQGDMIQGAKEEGLGELSTLLAHSDKVIAFGSGR
jgi:sulfur relay (sulfurtransferase) complex TusBCD TusD component (DsrE family)